MNKLKKIGLTALAGTLASLSAQAGELTVTGSAEISYTQRDKGEITGNPIVMNKNIAFAGSGELDNGWTVSISQGTNDAMGFSSAAVTIGMGSLGTVVVDGGTGADIGNALDNVMPTAFEEADAGFSTGLKDSGGVIGNHGSIKYFCLKCQEQKYILDTFQEIIQLHLRMVLLLKLLVSQHMKLVLITARRWYPA